jgi:hypothetical protein
MISATPRSAKTTVYAASATKDQVTGNLVTFAFPIQARRENQVATERVQNHRQRSAQKRCSALLFEIDSKKLWVDP